MSGVLLIGESERVAIDSAVAEARANAVPLAVLQAHLDGTWTPRLMLKDRKPGSTDFRKDYPPQNVQLGTYRVAISFEQQPGGLMRHLSVSSQAKGKVPGYQVMAMVCEAFGFSKAVSGAFATNEGKPVEADARIWANARVWLEEFEPGHMAVNVVELIT